MEKLIEALKVIKEACENTDCRSCPLSKNEDCLITNDNPMEWDILDKPTVKVLVGD